MAKKKSATGINKSQEIRNYLARNPHAAPKEVVAALDEQGIVVSEQLVSNVRHTSRWKGKKKRTVKKIAKPAPTKAVVTSTRPAALSADDLLEAKRLADHVGAIEQAKEALNALERLR